MNIRVKAVNNEYECVLEGGGQSVSLAEDDTYEYALIEALRVLMSLQEDVSRRLRQSREGWRR